MGRTKADLVDERRRAWRALVVTSNQMLGRLDAELRAAGDIDLQAYDALLHIFESGPDGARMTDLARAVVLTKAGLTSLVDRLEGRGLVTRRPDPADRRVSRIVLTREGLASFHRAVDVHLAGIGRHFGDRLSDDEARQVAEILERLGREDQPVE